MGDTNAINHLIEDETCRSFLKKDALITVGVGAILENEDWWQASKMARNSGQ